MSYRDFIEDYKKDQIGDTVLIYGEEDYLIRWATDMIIGKVLTDEEKLLSLSELQGAEDLRASEIIEAASTYSMLGKRRVLLVRDFWALNNKVDKGAKKDIDKIIRFVKSDHENCVLIFTLFGKPSGKNALRQNLIKMASSYEMSKLKRHELAAFVKKRFKLAQKTVSEANIDHLIEISGYFNRDSDYMLDDMTGDLTKIINAAAGSRIERDLIDELLNGDSNRFVFDFIDALMAGNRGEALAIVLNILSKDQNAHMQIIGLLTNQFEMMYDALEFGADGRSVRSIAKQLGINEYRFKKAYNAAKGFSQVRLSNILCELYEMDLKIKTGQIDGATALEIFVLSA